MRRLLRWSVVLLLLWGGWRLLPRLLEPWMPPPQMILVLGGDVEREKQAAALARQSNLPVLITGGSNPEYAQWVFEGQGVDAQKLQLDYAARDTLSNFTTLVDRLRRRGIRHVLLVTSSDRLRGAPMLAVLCGSLLISRLSAEVGQSRWRALSDEEQEKLRSPNHWRNNLQQLGFAVASLGEGLTGIVKQLKPAGKSGTTSKKWVRPELETSNAAEAEPGPNTSADVQSKETPETTPATSAPESEGEA